MGYTLDGPILWPTKPEASQPVNETLAFLSDSMVASGTDAEQIRSLRDVPRRTFSFSSLLGRGNQRIADAIRFDIGVRQFLLPIFPDQQWLTGPVTAGAVSISCRTTGFDFVGGGQVALWRNPQTWELATIDSISADGLALTAPTASAWGIGDKLYPVRKARLADTPKASWHTDTTLALDIAVIIDEPCDWPAAWPTGTLYRGAPVLEWRNEVSTDPADQYDRLSGSVDMDVGPVYYFDLPRMPFRVQSQNFKLYRRDKHTLYRSMLYALLGRAATLWVPTWLQDVQLKSPLASNAIQLHVPWMGYSQFGYLQQNRRDIAIELYDGTRFYRRITGCAESGDEEVLQMDSALGVALDPSAVRAIGWLSMCGSASDTFQIQHINDADGVAYASINWRAVKSNV